MDRLPDTQKFRQLCVSNPDMHHGTWVTHMPCCMPGSLTIGFLWSRWRGNRSQHSRHMCNQQFHVSGKRPIRRSCGYPWNKLNQLFFMPYIRLCVFSLPISLMMIVRIHALYLIIIIKSEVWPICHCSGLGNETLVYVVCLSIFLFLLDTWRPTHIVLTDILSQ